MCTPATTSSWTINKRSSLFQALPLIESGDGQPSPFFFCTELLARPLRPRLEDIHYLGEAASAGFFLLRSKNGLSHFFFVRERKLLPILLCGFVLCQFFLE